VVEVVADDADVTSGSGLPADVEMATTAADNLTPPVLVNNVETLANVPAIVAKGADWFRQVGTAESPGTIVCTITGAVQHASVAEVPMGTPLRTVLDEVGGGPREGRTISCVLMGVSNAVVTADELDLPISYEALRERGSGLGSASFIVIDDAVHPIAVAAGASRFLAVESCGQCTACKQDGLEISGLLTKISAGAGIDDDLQTIEKRLGTITDGARCSLAAQHQVVVGSILEHFAKAVADQVGVNDAVEPYVLAELLRIDDGASTIDDEFVTKQPDWTHDELDSGQSPAERLGEHRTPSA
jgi:NADH-quinone oxidoreductase subunit F